MKRPPLREEHQLCLLCLPPDSSISHAYAVSQKKRDLLIDFRLLWKWISNFSSLESQSSNAFCFADCVSCARRAAPDTYTTHADYHFKRSVIYQKHFRLCCCTVANHSHLQLSLCDIFTLNFLNQAKKARRRNL